MSAFIRILSTALLGLNSRVYSDGAKLVAQGKYTENDMLLIPT